MCVQRPQARMLPGRAMSREARTGIGEFRRFERQIPIASIHIC